MLNVIYAECHKKPIAMSVIRLSVVMLNVIMLNVVAPVQHSSNNPKTEGSNPAEAPREGQWIKTCLVGIVKSGNTKGGSITVPLNSCLTGLELAI